MQLYRSAFFPFLAQNPAVSIRHPLQTLVPLKNGTLAFSSRVLFLLLSNKNLGESAAFLPVIVGSRFKKRLANFLNSRSY